MHDKTVVDSFSLPFRKTMNEMYANWIFIYVNLWSFFPTLLAVCVCVCISFESKHSQVACKLQ